MWEVITTAFPLLLVGVAPLLMATVGGRFSEESGVSPLALEGFMLIGSFFAAASIKLLEQTALPPTVILIIGLFSSMLGGALLSLLHAYPSIRHGADQIISATAVNMLAMAVLLFFVEQVSSDRVLTISIILTPRSLAYLHKIPIVGPLLFAQSYWTTWLALALWAISFFVLDRTRFGLRLRAIGADPLAAEIAGVAPKRLQYIGVGISGMLAALGGGILLITYQGNFVPLRVGLGFVAIAALRSAGRKAINTLWSACAFGSILTILHLIPIPGELAKILFIVIVLVALVIAKKPPVEERGI